VKEGETREEEVLDLFDAAAEPSPEAEDGDAPPAPRVWTVSELNQTVRAFLEDALPPLWVGGEVANWTRARSGHCYFTLKDDRAQLRCVMWRGQAARLPMDPEEGMRVRGFGQLTLYEARGEYQFSVRELEGEGEEGLWKLAFEKVRLRLLEEGLLDPARKRPIPRWPRTVGVVTSPTGAALHDILNVLGRRAPWTRVLLRGARVQGQGAAQEIAQAVRALGDSGRVDLLIVGRGGGSVEDLWAFNEEVVARAIAESPVPVISAVGHEVDVTISDLVADLRAPTPSAAAEAAVQDGAALLELLGAVRPRLARGLRAQVDRRRHRLERGTARVSAGVERLLAPRRQVLERRKDRLTPLLLRLVEERRRTLTAAGDRLERGVRTGIHLRRERLARAAGRVDALSPLATLRRGYAVPLSREGGLLRSVSDFHAHPAFVLRVVDGRIDCQAGEVHPEDPPEEPTDSSHRPHTPPAPSPRTPRT
jgi:exodeoxyribonuclease VII large subunit